MRPAYILDTCTDGSSVVLDLSDKVGIPSAGRDGIGSTRSQQVCQMGREVTVNE